MGKPRPEDPPTAAAGTLKLLAYAFARHLGIRENGFGLGDALTDLTRHVPFGDELPIAVAPDRTG